jgi:hypothetical protein
MAKISMMATLGLTLALSTMTQASLLNDGFSSFLSLKDAPSEWDDKHIKYYMACARGGVAGFYQGFYKNDSETISKDCLGETTYQHLHQFVDFLTSGKINELFKSFGVFYQFSYDVSKQCRSNQLTFEVVGFCLNSTNNCSINSIINNFSKNIFSFTGTANTIIETVVGIWQGADTVDLTNLDKAASQFQDLGKSLGDIVRRVLGFTKTHSDARKPRNPATPTIAL